MFYKVLWPNDSISWIPARDLTDMAIDSYYIEINSKVKHRKSRRQKLRR